MKFVAVILLWAQGGETNLSRTAPLATMMQSDQDIDLELDWAEHQMKIRISVDFECVPLSDVVRLFAERTGLRITLGPLEEEPTVTIKLSDVPVCAAIRLILDPLQGHYFHRNGGIQIRFG